MVGRAVVIIVVSRAARKTDAQRESMMIVVSSAVREASGLVLWSPCCGGEVGGASLGFSMGGEDEASMLAVEESLGMVLSLEVSMSISCCWPFSSSVVVAGAAPASACDPASSPLSSRFSSISMLSFSSLSLCLSLGNCAMSISSRRSFAQP
jgi:hypothetical protein